MWVGWGTPYRVPTDPTCAEMLICLPSVLIVSFGIADLYKSWLTKPDPSEPDLSLTSVIFFFSSSDYLKGLP